jgi:hypothetical protein
MIRQINDPKTVELLNELADRYDALAEKQQPDGEDRSEPDGSDS